jgi:hypothetical protein
VDEKGKRVETDNGAKKGSYVCPACGEKAKGKGVLKTRTEFKDFPRISGWWHYLGMHTDETGKKARKKKDVACDWRPEGRHLGYQIGDAFIKQTSNGHFYRKYYEDRRKRRELTHPGAKEKNHRHAMSRHETARIFFSHFWTVARTLDDLPVTEPYITATTEHQYIPPPFWNGGK